MAMLTTLRVGRVTVRYLLVKVRAIIMMAKKSPGMGTMISMMEGDGSRAMLLRMHALPSKVLCFYHWNFVNRADSDLRAGLLNCAI